VRVHGGAGEGGTSLPRAPEEEIVERLGVHGAGTGARDGVEDKALDRIEGRRRDNKLPGGNLLMLNGRYETDLTDAAWELVKPLLPAARHGGRPRTTIMRAVVNAIFYLLRTGCQWRMLPHQFPPWETVYYYFRCWETSGTWVQLHRAIYAQRVSRRDTRRLRAW
jgi:transposase